MSNFRKNVLLVGNNFKNSKTLYFWEDKLKALQKTSFSDKPVLPIQACACNFIKEFYDDLTKDLVFEVTLHDYDKNTEGVEVRWFARVLHAVGYRVLARYIGAKEGDRQDFWINILSKEVHHVGSVHHEDHNQETIVYGLPLFIAIKFKDDLSNFINDTLRSCLKSSKVLSKKFEMSRLTIFNSNLKIGDRVEMINYNNSREVRPARIKNICGSRIKVHIHKEDYDGDWNPDEDRQLNSKGAEYWIDSNSFLIFPVGWAAFNGYMLNAKEEYKNHSSNIAEALKSNETPNYADFDVTNEKLAPAEISKELLSKVKIGQKLELLDPLAQQFQDFKVATVLEILPSNGYVIIGMDGPDAVEDSIPLHVSSHFIYPVGYAKKHGIDLVPPPNYKGDFKWSNYLKETRCEEMPVDLFKTQPNAERLKAFKVGAKLEVADMSENLTICPGTIKEVKGRVINVSFDGWDSEYDEYFDIDSHDIFPVGWCEVANHTLQNPTSS